MKLFLSAAVLMLVLGGCVASQGGSQGGDSSQPAPQAQSEEPKTIAITPDQAKRLQTIMTPLIAKMNRPIPANRVKITVWDDPHVNAANGGGGDFYVTTGLLQKASDDQLHAIMAHEIAHEDLGHVAKIQTLATGMDIGFVLLEQVVPGSSQLTPLAGALVTSAYSRSEETEADAHGVEILNRAGYEGRTLMANTLTWLDQTEGGRGGGFFASHPATDDRIDAVKRLPG
ncbi:MAG: M48 family metallopeptidase [Alphaproteobacteria bacterium]